MKTFANRKSAAGFSLLEVLIAVVITSVGLVALAALQLALIRSATTAKSQTAALSIAKQQIEKLRSFRTMADYIALDSSTTAGSCGTTPVNCVDGTPYSVATTITRYVLDGSAYAAVGNTTLESVLTADTAHHYVVGRDFKKASVQVTWTDSSNVSNAVTLDDVIDGLSPADSAKVARNSSGSPTRSVQVIITNPGNTAGVIAIPLATGDTLDTAATNPKPVVNSNATETRFNIFTYAGLSGTNNALAQSEVETALIGCTCDTAAAPTSSSARGYRPTYWNGKRYVAPTLTTYTPPAGQYSTRRSSESPYCTICCRDHNDPVGTTTAKFSPLRATHTHYGLNSSGALVAVGTGGQTVYKEACRLIRTDGIFRVAADYNDEYFGLLKTKNDGSSTEYAPASTAITNYQNFVLDYLDTKVVNNTDPTTYNTPVAAATVTTLESTRSINDPASITIQRSNDHKWLHSRGLYIDYLEPEALQAIRDAKANCVIAGCTTAQTQTAVLELMPFTSINLTELADWFPLVSSNSYISISNGAFTSSTAYAGNAPVRGYVVPATSGIPASAQTVNGTSTARNSNSGLQTLYDYAINNDEGSKTDAQAFAIPAGSSGSGGTFTVGYSGYDYPRNAAPQLSGTNITNCTSTKSGSNYTSTCSSTASGAVTLNATSYNAQSANTSKIAGISLTCTHADGTSPQTLVTTTSNKPAVYVCSNYAVTSALNVTTNVAGTVGAVTNSGLLAESTAINFSSVTPRTSPAVGDALQLTFTREADSYGYTCTYTSTISDAVVSPANCK